MPNYKTRQIISLNLISSQPWRSKMIGIDFNRNTYLTCSFMQDGKIKANSHKLSGQKINQMSRRSGNAQTEYQRQGPTKNIKICQNNKITHYRQQILSSQPQGCWTFTVLLNVHSVWIRSDWLVVQRSVVLGGVVWCRHVCRLLWNLGTVVLS